ncbi:MAG: PTS sugar transporter subunit IIA [Thermoguttaceae bacterium]|nr:PTS sugar transporter subunit IIA [Thermoguttaceae bacterium]
MEKRTYSAEQVAKFTHLPEKKVIKMADSGELEGQKIQGKWFFSKADLLVWFEKSLTGENLDQHLASMEDFAEHHVPQEEPEELPLAELLGPENILFPFTAKTKDSVIRTLAERGVELGKIWDSDRLAEALRQREEMLSTAMDSGVAILHPRRPMPDNTGEAFVLLGVALRGIPFGGGFGNLTDIFFLVCATDDKTHLRLLAEIARLLKRPGFLDQLRQCETVADIVALIRS